jgi:NAD(P)-dependent dehydrogenase (short-subunit alcohol dehydrogenase family)
VLGAVMLQDKVAAVTGSTRGIGKVIAAHLAAEGARVAVVGRSTDRGQRVTDAIVAAGGRAKLFPCDLSAERNVERLFDDIVDTWGPLDIVVNNAAPTDLAERDRPVTEQSTEDFEHFIRGGLYSVFWSFKYGIPAMNPAGGAFVTISSLAAVCSRVAEPSYAATKAAAAALTRQVAVDYGHLGIRANVLTLGFMHTNATASLLTDGRIGPMIRATTLGHVPTSEDCAKAVAFLVSDASAGFNGASLTLDGGMSALSHVPDLRTE